MKKYCLLLGLTLLLLIGCQKEMAELPTPEIPTTPTGAAQELPVVEVPQQEIPTIQPPAEIPTEEIVESAGKVHTVEINKTGFIPNSLTIKPGDTIRWVVIRNGTLNKAMINGAQLCIDVKSGILNAGESFEWTFNEPLRCNIVDGITTAQLFRLTVE
ncbi:MAG: hypothetical protein ABIA37_02390 [Candidatus Woesearchaeota archaeon]